MAVLDHARAHGPSLLFRIRHALHRAFDSFVAARTRSAEFEYYNGLSDSALAEKGLRREDIALHIFRDYCI